jgi:hypothetical protein
VKAKALHVKVEWVVVEEEGCKKKKSTIRGAEAKKMKFSKFGPMPATIAD